MSNSKRPNSVFERQKAESEAKRLRDEAETAAVYQDFVRSFDNDNNADANDELLANVGHGGSSRGGFSGRSGGMGGGGGVGGGMGKRHFTTRGGKTSGPGSLGGGFGGVSMGMGMGQGRKSGPGSLGPVAGRGTRRDGGFENFRDRESDKERLSNYNDSYRSSKTYGSSGPSRDTTATAAAFPAAEDDEDTKDSSLAAEKAASKPTLRLSSLPPGTSPATIKALIPSGTVSVEHVKILPTNPNSSTTERRSTSAIVTLAPDTPAAEIDTLVSQLQNRYLGFGFSLNISRHLSSSALALGTGLSAPGNIANASSSSLPFNARLTPRHTTFSRNAPPQSLGGQRGFAAPTSYISSTPYDSSRGLREPPTQVMVSPPTDLKQLQLIHLMLETLLTHGPEFEALLMSRREVQREAKWAWLWDARSRGGVYYRWRLWAILTGVESKSITVGGTAAGIGGKSGGHFLFENSTTWVPPDRGLKFEYVTKLEDLIQDEAYDSSEEEDMADDEGRAQRRRRADQMAEVMGSGSGVGVGVGAGAGGSGGADAGAADGDGMGYLNPMAKAKLIHLLARLPDSNTKLRRGDVARVTAFAIEHAGEGAGEIASIITANVGRPLCFTRANPARPPTKTSEGEKGADSAMTTTITKEDTSPASLVGLYLISDILMSSTTSGVRHAWRYRALFESSLQKQETFHHLGLLERELGWGRLKAEKWKRSVQTLLGMWEGWCVFSQGSHEGFVEAFLKAPGAGEADDAKEEKAEGEKGGWKKVGQAEGKWKTVEEGDVGLKEVEMKDADGVKGSDENADEGDLDGDPMIEDDEDAVMAAVSDEDLDGDPMIDSSDEDPNGDPKADSSGDEAPGSARTGSKSPDDGNEARTEAKESTKSSNPTNQRPSAVDMFADDEAVE